MPPPVHPLGVLKMVCHPLSIPCPPPRGAKNGCHPLSTVQPNSFNEHATATSPAQPNHIHTDGGLRSALAPRLQARLFHPQRLGYPAAPMAPSTDTRNPPTPRQRHTSRKRGHSPQERVEPAKLARPNAWAPVRGGLRHWIRAEFHDRRVRHRQWAVWFHHALTTFRCEQMGLLRLTRPSLRGAKKWLPPPVHPAGF